MIFKYFGSLFFLSEISGLFSEENPSLFVDHEALGKQGNYMELVASGHQIDKWMEGDGWTIYTKCIIYLLCNAAQLIKMKKKMA